MKLQEAMERARHIARFRHLSHKTEKSYLHWISRYGHWCANHPDGSGSICDGIPMPRFNIAEDLTRQPGWRYRQSKPWLNKRKTLRAMTIKKPKTHTETT